MSARKADLRVDKRVSFHNILRILVDCFLTYFLLMFFPRELLPSFDYQAKHREHRGELRILYEDSLIARLLTVSKIGLL